MSGGQMNSKSISSLFSLWKDKLLANDQASVFLFCQTFTLFAKTQNFFKVLFMTVLQGPVGRATLDFDRFCTEFLYHFLEHGCIYYHKAIFIAYNLKYCYLNCGVAGEWSPIFPLAKFEEMGVVAAKPTSPYSNSFQPCSTYPQCQPTLSPFV